MFPILGDVPGQQGYWPKTKKLPFLISVVDTSFRSILKTRQRTLLDLSHWIREKLGFQALEVSTEFFPKNENSLIFARKLLQTAKAQRVRLLILTQTEELELAALDEGRRLAAVKRLQPWIEVTQVLECHSLRCRIRTRKDQDAGQQLGAAVKSLKSLAHMAARFGINIIVENYGGLTSHGKWLQALLQQVNRPNCGASLNLCQFRIDNHRVYPLKNGIIEIIPFAKSVSIEFRRIPTDQNPELDCYKALSLIVQSGYRGYVGIVWKGPKEIPLEKGLISTRRYLEKVRAVLAKRKEKSLIAPGNRNQS